MCVCVRVHVYAGSVLEERNWLNIPWQLDLQALSLLSYKVKARSVFKIARFILRVLLFAFLTLKFLIARRATLVVVSRERNDLENVPRLSSFLASREYRLCQ